jgi:hypothetical protein
VATDNEQLVLSISADVRQIQRQMKSLVGQTQRDTKAIEAAFGGIEKSGANAYNGIAANSNYALKSGIKNANDLERAMKQSNAQAVNMTYQLQDIGVQLAGGQSPWLIGIQQISQMNLGALGLRGSLTAIGGAATSILSPINLAALAFVGLGGTALQYFGSVISEGNKSEETLQKQGELIRNLAKEWGDTIPALREYADELERTQKIAALQQGAQIINAQNLEDVKESVKDARLEIANLVNELQTAGEESEVILSLQRAFDEFTSAANDGSVKLEDVHRVQDALSAAINSSGIPSIDAFRKMFDNLSASALDAAGSVRKLNAETGAATTALFPSQGTYAGVDRDAESNIQNGGFMTPETGPVPDRRPLIELEGLPKGGGRKTRDAEAEKIKREKEAVVELIAQLQFEQDMLEATDVERAKANALRQAGAVATDEQKAKISELIEQTYAERDAILANRDAMLALQDASREVLQGIVSDLRDGKSGADILANALDRIASRLLDSAFDGLFSGGSGGLFGGKIIPGILHSGGVAGRDGYGHGRSVSPSVFNGATRYHTGGVAGLKPDEVPAILQKGERIIPRGGSTSGGANVSLSFAPVIDARGADVAAVARLEQVVAKQGAEMQGRVEAAVRSAQKRNVKLG